MWGVPRTGSAGDGSLVALASRGGADGSMGSVAEEHDDGEKIDAAEALKQEQKACAEETRAAEKAKLDAKLKGASDYYELLDVKRDATRVQIKKANMKLLKKCVACAPKPGNGAIPGGARFVRNTC